MPGPEFEIMTIQDKPVATCDTLTLEMQSIVRSAAEPWAPGDSVKAALNRASRTLGISYRRARTFWYGHPCAVLAIEADQLRAKQTELLRKRQKQLNAELADVKARIARLEGRI